MTTATPIRNKQCPWCQGGDEESTVQRIGGEAPEPKPGDPCLCTICGKWSVWTADSKLEKPDEKMARRIAESPEALKLKLALMVFKLSRRKKKSKGLSTQALLDIRNKAVDEARDRIFASVQLCEQASEALEIYMGVMLDQVINASVLYGCVTPNMDGEDCIEKVLNNLVVALDKLDIASLVDERVEAHRHADKQEPRDDS